MRFCAYYSLGLGERPPHAIIKHEHYGTVFYALDREDALEIIEQRNLGERLTEDVFPNPKFPSNWIAERNWSEALHAACWLGMIGGKARLLGAWDLLHDQGLIHTLAHLVNRDQKQFECPCESLKQLMELAFSEAIRLENLVRGFKRYPGDFS